MLTYKEHMRRAAREYFRVLLDEYEGNVTEAVRAAGLNRTHFYQLINKWGRDLLHTPNRQAEVVAVCRRAAVEWWKAHNEREGIGPKLPRLRI